MGGGGGPGLRKLWGWLYPLPKAPPAAWHGPAPRRPARDQADHAHIVRGGGVGPRGGRRAGPGGAVHRLGRGHAPSMTRTPARLLVPGVPVFNVPCAAGSSPTPLPRGFVPVLQFFFLAQKGFEMKDIPYFVFLSTTFHYPLSIKFHYPPRPTRNWSNSASSKASDSWHRGR